MVGLGPVWFAKLRVWVFLGFGLIRRLQVLGFTWGL